MGTRVCSVENCGKKYFAKTWCRAHYMKVRRTGTLQPLKASAGMSVEERLRYKGWDVVESGCWEVRGARKNSGYGSLQYGGWSQATHRLAYQTWVGPIPDGHLIRHKCDNPPCINPDHLETGTDSDNSKDMMSRGRHRTLVGADHPMCKLSWVEAEAIRDAYGTGVFTLKMLGEAFGVSYNVVSKVVRGQSYRSPSISP